MHLVLKNKPKWAQKNISTPPHLIIEPHYNHQNEGFIAKYARGKLSVQGFNKVGERQGELFFHSILPSGLWPEFLGHSQPIGSIRPIWLSFEMSSRLLLEEGAEVASIIHQTLEAGFNTLILEWLGEYDASLLNKLHICLKENGIRLVVELSRLPKAAFQFLMHLLDREVGIFVCSQIDEEYSEIGQEKLYFDKIVEDVTQWEQRVKNNQLLIYYLPHSGSKIHPHFLKELSLKLNGTTFLSFPAFRKNNTAHPFWIELRQMQHSLGVPLLPFIDLKSGSNSSLFFDVFESYFYKEERHRFMGFGAALSHFDLPGSFTHGNLWIIGHQQWRRLSSDVWIETWFRSFYPDQNYEEYKSLLKGVRHLQRDIQEHQEHWSNGSFSYEEMRWIGDSLLSSIKLLELKLSKNRDMNKMVELLRLSLKQIEDILASLAYSQGIHLSSKYPCHSK